MSPISVRDSAARRGFTLVEVMIASSLLAVVLAGVLAAYLFVGRNLTRLVNLQQQEVESRRVLRQFTQDVSAAMSLTTAISSPQLTLTKPPEADITPPNTQPDTVYYFYTPPSPSGTATGIFERKLNDGPRQKVLSGLTTLTITYYNERGSIVTSSNHSMKAAELSFTSEAGSAKSGTQARYTTVSPRVVMRNKPALE